MGIDENSFMMWIESPPQFLAWIATMFRMKSAESGMKDTVFLNKFRIV